MKYVDQRASGNFGIARFSKELGQHLSGFAKFRGTGSPFSPWDPFLLSFRLPADAEYFFSTGVSGPLLSKVPYAICIHDLIQLDLPEQFSFLKRLYFQTVTRLIARRAHVIFTVSEFSKERICHHFGISPDKVFVLGNGVAEVFSPASGAMERHRREPYFFNYSGGKPHKNVNRLIDAFLSVESRLKQRLLIAGVFPEDFRRRYESARIRFVGPLSDADLVDHIRGATAVVFPSIYEGFGLPIVEAFACGTPVLASNAASMPEVAQGHALLVDPFDTGAIAAGLLELGNATAAVHQEMSRPLPSIAKQYDWSRLGAKALQVINSY